MKGFSEVFVGEPEARADAPGRVNLLGEHTDYSEGFVLPTAIPQRTRVSLRRSRNRFSTVYSADLDRSAQFILDELPSETFARYVYGCLRQLADAGTHIPHLDIHVGSEIPIGVGLSSSAALEIATLRAIHQLLGINADPVQIAHIAHRAETEYAGVRCGILDQMACSLLDGEAMLFLDTRSLARRLLPLPEGSEIIVIDCGVSRALASTHYNLRRAECEEAARMLGVPALRDISDVTAIERLPEPWRRRARHVITENDRAVRASQSVDATTFGALMSASHRSLRDDFEVSIPAMDDLVASLMAQPRVFGAKLTGAGFGGACVALCHHGEGMTTAERVLGVCNISERRVLVPAR
ncbi:MAG TPA: galactokinase [Casimicrobiaceae bacterium]|nr:galactokinase [Casimicrobiaceae bacterium]